MTKLKLASVLASLVAMSAILTVEGLSIVAGEPFGSARTAAAEISLSIMVAATLTLVTVDVMTVLRGRRQTKTENRNQYAPQQVNAGAFNNGLVVLENLPWQSGQAAFAAKYCDKCGNRL